LAELSEHLLPQLRERLAPLGVEQLHPLAGGASSLTYAGTLSGRPVVVKVAPPGVEPVLHRDVLRQSRMIRVLGATPVPVPDVLIEDAGDPPEVPPLFVMSRLTGTSFEPLFDTEGDDAIPIVSERFRDAAATMAQLHRLAPTSIGLGSEPVLGAGAEIDRWSRTLETVDSALVPGWRSVVDALRTCVPPALPPAILHGDFRLGNLLAEGARVTGVIDWEIWSIGDPRVDAGWFLINSDPKTYRRDTPYVGKTPSVAELVAIYSDALGRELLDLSWFQALACFKSAATWSLIVKHNRRRPSPKPDVEAMTPVLPELLLRARRLLG
jgi:aminoglycoside phosphotransferase (APT) family kinase protein